MLYLIYLISKWQRATVAQSWVENSALDSSCSPSSLQDRVAALPILPGFCFCFTAVQHGITMTSLSQTSLLPHWFSVLPWSQRRLPAIAPRWREKERAGGGKRKSSPQFSWFEQIQFHEIPAKGSAHNRVTVPWHCQYVHVGLITIIPTLFK